MFMKKLAELSTYSRPKRGANCPLFQPFHRANPSSITSSTPDSSRFSMPLIVPSTTLPKSGMNLTDEAAPKLPTWSGLKTLTSMYIYTKTPTKPALLTNNQKVPILHAGPHAPLFLSNIKFKLHHIPLLHHISFPLSP